MRGRAAAVVESSRRRLVSRSLRYVASLRTPARAHGSFPMRSTPATSGQVSARAMSADRRGAEPPLSLSRCQRRAWSTARGSIRPRTLTSATAVLAVTTSARAAARPRVGAFAASVGRYRGPLAQVSPTFRSPRDEWRECAVVQIDAETLEVELPHKLHAEQARLERDPYLRVWQSLHEWSRVEYLEKL